MSEPLCVAVVSLEEPGGACAGIRLLDPLSACGRSLEIIWAVETRGRYRYLSNELDRADVIVVQRFFPNPDTAAILDDLLRGSTPVVYEVDDLLTEVTERNPHRPLASQCGPYILDTLRRADAVVVSTEQLAQYYADLNERIHVLPNLVDPRRFRPGPPHSREVTNVLFAGTPTHAEDLEIIEGALVRVWQRFRERVRFTYMGCVTPELASIPGTTLIEMEPDYRVYADRLSALGIDLAVVPLHSHRFNRCKSNIKWLEYSACNIAGIYSDLPPYSDYIAHEKTGLLVSQDEDAWVEAMVRMIEAPELHSRIAEAARQTVLERFTLDARAHLYGDFYAGLREQRGETPSPDFSIIVPVFNRCDLTRMCLEAVQQTLAGHRGEIIVVDDGSSDGTAAYLESLGRAVRVIRNRRNLGFAAACNRGVAQARGEFVVFLNNDTTPEAGWLEPLLDEVRSSEATGVVGAKLLYPDRRIQHAGVAFSVPNGVPYNLFRGAPEDFEPSCQRREYRAVTGACMLVRRSLFRALDGFDERYRNGFEDVDFCLRAREQGARVIYQPQSVVVHLEEQSEGRKDFDVQNLTLFLNRWAERNPPDEIGILLEAGLVTRATPNGTSRSLETLRDPAERSRWTEAAELASKVERCGHAALRDDPPAASRWPRDAAVLRWGELACRRAGAAETASAFAKRLNELEARRPPEDPVSAPQPV